MLEKKWHLNWPYEGPAPEGSLALERGFHGRRSRASEAGSSSKTNYGRREIAQRVRPTHVVNHASPDAIARAATERERQLIGLHPQAFYDG